MIAKFVNEAREVNKPSLNEDYGNDFRTQLENVISNYKRHLDIDQLINVLKYMIMELEKEL